jgi:NAD(P)-dependent dehydrogenase (short-subunit alcohol dehydrogenase family)
VLLATTSQLTTALALIELDAIARRLVILPPDVEAEHLGAVIAAAEVDAAVIDDGTAAAPVLALPVRVGCAPSIVPMDEALPARVATEWLLMTSGTTGVPKLVVHDLSALTAAITAPSPADGAAIWGTFYDIRRYGGLQIFLRAVLGGACLVLSSAGEPVGDHLARLAQHGVTHLSGTPSQWRRALISPAIRGIAPRYVRLSGEIADQAILDGLRAAFPRATIGHAYASTEAGVAFDVNDGLAGFPAGYVGAIRDGVEMKIVDGSLRIRSSRTASRFAGGGPKLADADGFVDTGDIVERRGDRYTRRPQRRHHQYRRLEGSPRRNRGSDQPPSRRCACRWCGRKQSRSPARSSSPKSCSNRTSSGPAPRQIELKDGHSQVLPRGAAAPQGSGRDQLRAPPSMSRRPASFCAGRGEKRCSRAPGATRSVLVTGGSRGLGLAIAQKLATTGYRVIAVARNKSKEVTAAMTQADRAGPGALHFVPFDFGKIDAIPKLVRDLRKEFGPLFGLVNNAALGHYGALATMHNSKLEEQVRVNTLAPIVLTKYVVRGMMADGAGRIVNVASIIGFTGLQRARSLRCDQDLDDRVYPLARPRGGAAWHQRQRRGAGFIATDMTQGFDAEVLGKIMRRTALRRLAEVEDVANAVEFLLGDKARNITGTVLTVDAGATA